MWRAYLQPRAQRTRSVSTVLRLRQPLVVYRTRFGFIHGFEGCFQACQWRLIILVVSEAHSRLEKLGKEYVAMQKESPPYVWAQPEETNILTCTCFCLSELAV
jgi:hypothetical protein